MEFEKEAHDAMSDITATRLLIKQLEWIISCKYEMPKDESQELAF